MGLLSDDFVYTPTSASFINTVHAIGKVVRGFISNLLHSPFALLVELMSFSKLPLELTQRITSFTIPNSFENAAATCKLFYVCEPLLS
jgi:hypothetical protein